MSISMACIVTLATLVIITGFFVSITRAKVNVLCKNIDDPEDKLHKMVRAHGNTTEYAPILALLIFILGQTSQPVWVSTLMVLVTFSRAMIVAGLIFPKSMAVPNSLRLVGAMGTYIFGAGLIVVLALQQLH